MKPHSHSHAHACSSHSHPPSDFNKAFLIAILANGGFVLCQIIFAITAHSTSLLADAVHNLGDVLGLVVAGIANNLLKRSPTTKKSYGFKKISILAALSNGMFLVFSCGIIAAEALYQLFSPKPIHSVAVMIVGSIGIVVNWSTAYLFLKGKADLNIRAAYLHLIYDALISAGVVIAAIIIYFTGWLWLDPLMALSIALIILSGTWELFKDSLQLLIDGVPSEISLQTVKAFFMAQAGVESVHDLHIWALSTQENALSVHLLMPTQHLNDETRQQLVRSLKEEFNIHHSTIQIEQNSAFCEDSCKF